VRYLSALPAALLFLAVLKLSAAQPLSEEEKKRLFLKAREEMTTIPYTPPPSAAPTPRPKPRTPAPVPAPTPRPTTTPAPVQKPTPEPRARPTPLPVTPPRQMPTPRIVVTAESRAEADKDEEPPPPRQSVLSRLFGRGGGYTYLTSSVRRAIDRAPVRKARWRYIVVHNSGTRQGSAKAFEHYHRYVRKMPNGLAYHFVIGNGTSTKVGAIEIGNRWYRQLQGGHVHSDYLNNIALGICLVGDFNHGKPKDGQLDALTELIEYLRRRVGTIQGQRAVVRSHRDINPAAWPTDCPGDDFPYSWLRRKF
jgi:hypothetical protein